MEIEKKYDDVPLADINRVFEAIQNKIEEGNIRNIYAIRFGYCCYIGENDEDVLFAMETKSEFALAIVGTSKSAQSTANIFFIVYPPMSSSSAQQTSLHRRS